MSSRAVRHQVPFGPQSSTPVPGLPAQERELWKWLASQDKFARYYAPAAFNTPQTLDQIFQYNDVQLFDLKQDPQELHNLALDREKNKDLILRMNTLLNELTTKEVGKHDSGSFLPAAVRPDHSVVFDRQ
jgi:arylsulfatase A-like enzyme